MKETVRIADHEIGAGNRPFIIAEMSGNHNQDINRAKALIQAAARAGADAVKLQTYTADTITIRSDRPEFRIHGGLWDGRTLYELYEEAHTPWEWHPQLFAAGAEEGVVVFSSPFDATAVDFLQSLQCPAYKIASPEIVDWNLLEKVAATGKPIIVSTGMAIEQEVDEAMEVLRSNGAEEVVLLHCVSAYPAPVEACNLRRIPAMMDRYGVPVGLSDHTMGLEVPLAAIALGAAVIEKHFTLRRADGGVDSAFSLEAEELAQLCQAANNVHAALGSPEPGHNPAEDHNRKFRRSLYFMRAMKAGDVVKEGDLRSIRPGMGLPPKYLARLIGTRLLRDASEGEPATWEHFGGKSVLERRLEEE